MLNRQSRLVLALAVCLLSLGGFQAAPPADDPQADVYAPDRVLDIDITMAAEDWHEVRISHRDGSSEELEELADDDAYQYRRADVTIDGVTIESVGVRKKGFVGSAVSTRPSLKIEFDEYVDDQSFEGVERLTLNNNNQDPTFVNQYLTYDLIARAGAPAPRVNFARVRVNGEDLGIYTNVEPIRKPLLRRLFDNDDGLLYESYAGDFNEERLYRIVGKDGPSERNRQPLEELTTLLASPDPVSLERIEELVDLDSFIRLWAAEVLIGLEQAVLPAVGSRRGLPGSGSVHHQSGSQVGQGARSSCETTVGTAGRSRPLSGGDETSARRPVG
jgi:spore coat protein CotH